MRVWIDIKVMEKHQKKGYPTMCGRMRRGGLTSNSSGSNITNSSKIHVETNLKTKKNVSQVTIFNTPLEVNYGERNTFPTKTNTDV